MHSDGSDDVHFPASAILDQAGHPLIIAIAALMFLLTMVIIVMPLIDTGQVPSSCTSMDLTLILRTSAILIRFCHDRD